MAVEDDCHRTVNQFEILVLEESPTQVDVLAPGSEPGVKDTNQVENVTTKGGARRYEPWRVRIAQGTRLPKRLPHGYVALGGGLRRIGHYLPHNDPDFFMLESLNQLAKPPGTHHTVLVSEGQNLSSASLDPSIPRTGYPSPLLPEIPDREALDDLGRSVCGAIIHYQDFPALRRVVRSQKRNEAVSERLLPVQDWNYYRDERRRRGVWQFPSFHR
jgi:hypothetical protein